MSLKEYESAMIKIPSSRRWEHLAMQEDNDESVGEEKHPHDVRVTTNYNQRKGSSQLISLQTYVNNHDFSRLMKPTHRNPLIADKGRISIECKSDINNQLHNPMSQVLIGNNN